MCVCAMTLGGDQIYCNCAYEVIIPMCSDAILYRNGFMRVLWYWWPVPVG